MMYQSKPQIIYAERVKDILFYFRHKNDLARGILDGWTYEKIDNDEILINDQESVMVKTATNLHERAGINQWIALNDDDSLIILSWNDMDRYEEVPFIEQIDVMRKYGKSDDFFSTNFPFEKSSSYF